MIALRKLGLSSRVVQLCPQKYWTYPLFLEEKQPALVKALRGAYADGIKLIKSGKDEDFFKANAKEFFNLSTSEEIAARIGKNRENYADLWGPSFFESQNKILQIGVSLGLLPNVGNLNDLWIR